MHSDHVVCVLGLKGLEALVMLQIMAPERRLTITLSLLIWVNGALDSAMSKTFPDILSWPSCLKSFGMSVE